MKLFILILTFLLGNSFASLAQNSFKRLFWEAKNLPGGSYIVALDSISSISLQTYTVDGVIEVTETAIDTQGGALARFYFIEKKDTPSSSASEKVKPIVEAAKKTKETLENLVGVTDPLENQGVVKNYPATTHAKTIEYRFANKAEVQRIYENVSKAFKEGVTINYEPDKK